MTSKIYGSIKWPMWPVIQSCLKITWNSHALLYLDAIENKQVWLETQKPENIRMEKILNEIFPLLIKKVLENLILASIWAC